MLYTHMHVDLDAVASVWAARMFIPAAARMPLAFRPANWDGSGMTDDDYALDIEAGGRGIKGHREEDGTVHSCFATLIGAYAPPQDAAALTPIVRFIDVQDANGSAVYAFARRSDLESKQVLGATSLNAVLQALRAAHGGNDALIVERMSEIFTGMLQVGRSQQDAQRAADKARLLDGGKVAITINLGERVAGTLFSRGVRVIVYQDGHSIGIIRHHAENLRVDHPDLQAVVGEAGEAPSWFAHSKGFLYCRGSRKAPAETPSRVKPEQLAAVANRLLG